MGKVMTRRFNKFVQDHDNVGRSLPLTHATDAYSARQIFDDGQLTPRPCPVFGELILYFFYGRVAYRVHPDEPPSALKSYAPVCFVVKPEIAQEAKRIFPFDTGAFKGDLYKETMHHRMRFGDFELDASFETPQRLVKAFFGTNTDYIANEPCLKKANDPLDFEVESFIALINDPTKNIRDDRASAIEIQLDKDVTLQGSLVAAILPNDLAKSKLVKDLGRLKATPLFYSITNRMKPSEHVGSLASTLQNFFREEGFV
jgi:hypothetical protein